jgi:hypothetical protein
MLRESIADVDRYYVQVVTVLATRNDEKKKIDSIRNSTLQLCLPVPVVATFQEPDP